MTNPLRWRLGTVTFLATQFVLLTWWIAFFPGLMSYDTVMYVWQVSTGNWSTNHSVLYDGLVWLSLQASGQLWPLSLAQTAALSGGLAYAVTGSRRLGVPGRWLAGAAILATCLPVIGTFSVYVSKDVAFVICEVWLLGTLARVVAQSVLGGRPRPRHAGELLAELALIGLFRQNGFVAIGLLANLALFPALGVKPAGSELMFGPAYADLAVAYAQRPALFTADDRRLLSTVAPLSYWSGSANCYNADATVSYGHPQFNFPAARQHAGELFGLWLRIAKRAPDEIVQTRLCRGSIAWNPFPGPARGWTVKIPIAGTAQFFNFPRNRIANSPFASAITSTPPSRLLHQVAVWLRRLSDTRAFEWLLWRGATWSYVAYLAIAAFAVRSHRWQPLALVAVVAANQLNVMANNPGQLVRYMVGPLVLGIVLAPFAFASRDRLARDALSRARLVPAALTPDTARPARTDLAPDRDRGPAPALGPTPAPAPEPVESEPGHAAELAIAGVAEPGHDESPVVEPLIDGGRDQPHRQA
jgi:hypothetical protein